MHLLGLFILPLAIKHVCKVVHAGEGGGMLTAQHLLIQNPFLLVHLLGLAILPLAVEHKYKVVYAVEGRGMLVA